jgi:hypothetical protein
MPPNPREHVNGFQEPFLLVRDRRIGSAKHSGHNEGSQLR